MHIDFKGESLNNLLIKFNYYKGKFLRSPQQIMYERANWFILMRFTRVNLKRSSRRKRGRAYMKSRVIIH